MPSRVIDSVTGQQREHRKGKGDRQSRQIFEVRGREDAPVLLPCLTRQLSKARTGRRSHALGDGMIVIAPDRGRRVLAHPVDARNRLYAVLDEITDEQTGIERLVDNGAERCPVGVNVGQYQNLHATLFPMPKPGFQNSRTSRWLSV